MFIDNVVRIKNTPNGTTVNSNYIKSPAMNFDKV